MTSKLPRQAIVILLLLGVLVLVAIIFFFSRPGEGAVLPTDYQSCLNYPFSSYNDATCALTVSGNNNSNVQKCLSLGGCNSSGGSSECNITFFNPGFVYPKNFADCRIAAAGKNGPGSASLSFNSSTCSILLAPSCAANLQQFSEFVGKCPVDSGYLLTKKFNAFTCQGQFNSSEK